MMQKLCKFSISVINLYIGQFFWYHPLLLILVLCPFPPQVNQIHSFTGCHENPQGSWDLWILRYPKGCSHCPVHLYTKIRVSCTPYCSVFFDLCITTRCWRWSSSFLRSAVILLFFQKPFSSGKVISKRQVCWKSLQKNVLVFFTFFFVVHNFTYHLSFIWHNSSRHVL